MSIRNSPKPNLPLYATVRTPLGADSSPIANQHPCNEQFGRFRPDMRRIVVTGANKGIGLAIVRGILSEHADTFVFLGSRDASRGEHAREQLIEENASWSSRLVVVPLDVTSDSSVTGSASAVGETLLDANEPLYALVNNAGVRATDRSLNDVLAANIVGMRRVCEAFFPLLQSEGGRVVNITSAAGPTYVSKCSAQRQHLFTDPQVTWPQIASLMDECLGFDSPEEFKAAGLATDAYGLSKACANAYTLLLARQYPALRINSCTPGFIETDLTQSYIATSGKTATELGMKSPKDGARCPLFLLFSELEGNGRYYGSDLRTQSARSVPIARRSAVFGRLTNQQRYP